MSRNTKTNPFIESMNQLSDSYIEEALDMTSQQTAPHESGRQMPHHRLYPLWIAAATAAGIVIGVLSMQIYGRPDSLRQAHTDKSTDTSAAKDSFFTPLRVVAYAAEASDDSQEQGTELEADVPTVLSKYSAMMSSVPAMPFSFSYDEKTEEEIHFRISSDDTGILQKYNADVTWTLTEEASSLECLPEEKVYWSPADIAGQSETDDTDSLPAAENINPKDLGADSVITVQVYSGKKLLETRYIGISYEDMYYTATLKLKVSTDREEFGDFVIESNLYEASDHATHEKLLDQLKEKTADGEAGAGGEAAVPQKEPDTK